MSRMLTCTTAIALAAFATGACADVTPEEVWESWQAMSTAVGQELTVGGSARNGDTLEVTGIVISFKDDLGGSASASLDKLSFKDNGDGTVAVIMPDTFPLTVMPPPEEGGPTEVKLSVMQPGMKITAGGSATETSYDIAAPTSVIQLTEVKDATGAVIEAQAMLAMTEVTAKYLVATEGDKTRLDSSFSAKALALTLEGKDPEGTGQGKVLIAISDIAGTTKGNFLGAEMMKDMAAALNAGFTTENEFTFGMMTMDVDVTDDTGPTKMVVTSTLGGGFELALNKDSMRYGTSLGGANFVVSGPEIPFPEVQFGFAEFAFNILMPVSKSEMPQDFGIVTKLVDFTISEDIWGMFDPASTLARDPATFILDLRGTGFWKQDIMDPAIDLDSIEAPGELSSLDLTLAQVKAAGADVAATGALTFDNADLVTFQGVPKPTGLVTVTIKGVNALIDNLISMGLLPEEEAMGFRMMLGMFARPGAAADELISEIEFKDGGLFANGQQLQ
ncbi:Protein of unknown function DUF2125 [Paracoccaceae bacterium]